MSTADNLCHLLQKINKSQLLHRNQYPKVRTQRKQEIFRAGCEPPPANRTCNEEVLTCPGRGGVGVSLCGAVQCIKDNGHMEPPRHNRMTDTTENFIGGCQ